MYFKGIMEGDTKLTIAFLWFVFQLFIYLIMNQHITILNLIPLSFLIFHLLKLSLNGNYSLFSIYVCAKTTNKYLLLTRAKKYTPSSYKKRT